MNDLFILKKIGESCNISPSVNLGSFVQTPRLHRPFVNGIIRVGVGWRGGDGVDGAREGKGGLGRAREG